MKDFFFSKIKICHLLLSAHLPSLNPEMMQYLKTNHFVFSTHLNTYISDTVIGSGYTKMNIINLRCLGWQQCKRKNSILCGKCSRRIMKNVHQERSAFWKGVGWQIGVYRGNFLFWPPGISKCFLLLKNTKINKVLGSQYSLKAKSIICLVLWQ